MQHKRNVKSFYIQLLSTLCKPRYAICEVIIGDGVFLTKICSYLHNLYINMEVNQSHDNKMDILHLELNYPN